MPISDVSPITPSQPNSSPAQVPTVPSPNLSLLPEPTRNSGFAPNPNQASLQQPETSSIPNSGFTPNLAQTTIMPNSDVSSIIQQKSLPEPAQVPYVPPIVHPNSSPVDVPIVPSPIPQAQTTIMPNFDSAFNPNLAQATMNSDFVNAQQSLSSLMSEALFNWPNPETQFDQGPFEDQLFDFSGFQDFSGGNFLNSDMSSFWPDSNVRLLFKRLQIIIHIFIVHPCNPCWTGVREQSQQQLLHFAK